MLLLFDALLICLLFAIRVSIFVLDVSFDFGESDHVVSRFVHCSCGHGPFFFPDGGLKTSSRLYFCTPSVLNYKSFQEFWRVKVFQV